jgi:hypothetical protein
MAKDIGRRSKLDEFIATYNKEDFARPAHFRFSILPASVNSNFNSKFMTQQLQAVNMLCDSASLPDIASIPTTASVGEEFPYDIVHDMAYASISASFYVRDDMFQKKFFDDWMELTYNKNDGQPYYYDDYTTTVEIYQLKRTLDYKNLTGDNDWTYKNTLYNVYPKSIAPLSLDWSSTNAIQKLSVTFHYTHWDSETNSN